MKRLLAFIAALALLAVPRMAAIAQLQPGCYNGMAGNGSASGNVISSITTQTTTSMTISGGCTPSITVGPTLSANDFTSVGEATTGSGTYGPIMNGYFTNLEAIMYGFGPATNVLNGYAMDGLTMPGSVTTTYPAPIPTSSPGNAVFGIETGSGSYVNNVGASMVIGPTTVQGTAGNSQRLYFVANTSTSSQVSAPYMYANTGGSIFFSVESPQQIATNNAPINMGSGYLIYGGEHNMSACGGTAGTPMSSGTSGAPVALNNQGPNCIGTFNGGVGGSANAFYTFSNSNLTYPCVTGATEIAPVTLPSSSYTPASIAYTLTLASTTWTLIFQSSNATDSAHFSFHLAACPF